VSLRPRAGWPLWRRDGPPAVFGDCLTTETAAPARSRERALAAAAPVEIWIGRRSPRIKPRRQHHHREHGDGQTVLDVACHRQCDEEGSNHRPRCQCRYRDSGEWSSRAALLSRVVCRASDRAVIYRHLWPAARTPWSAPSTSTRYVMIFCFTAEAPLRKRLPLPAVGDDVNEGCQSRRSGPQDRTNEM
jgi:hypothetical protein